MSLSIHPFEKQPNFELRRTVCLDRLSVRALGERIACDVKDVNFPTVMLSDEMIQKANANRAPTKPTSTEVAGRVAVQSPTVETKPALPDNVTPISAAKSYEAPVAPQPIPAQSYASMAEMADQARARVEAA